MATCFVIQPFDNGKYDKRFKDIYKPAIEAAGMEAYRVDRDPSVQVPIESIEKGIRQASVYLAEITEDNPNVWYELGYAFAAERPVVMVCASDRTGKKYPFDIQHRSVISYSSDSPSDFEALKKSLTEKIAAIVEQDVVLDQIQESDPTAPIQGLSQTEVLVLAVIAGELFLPDSAATVLTVKRQAERASLTSMGVNLAFRKLKSKEFIEDKDLWDEHSGSYLGVTITENGWRWIEENEDRFVLHRQDKRRDEADEKPF